MSRFVLITVLLCLLTLSLSGCEPAVREQPERQAVTTRAWPEPPAQARLTYVNTITGPADLGIRRNLLGQLGELISGASQVRMVRPMEVVVVADGGIYVADPGVRGIHWFDRRHGRYALIQGANEEALPSPVALAATADGTVYVSDSRLAAVYVIAPGATDAVRFRLDALLARPTGIAFDNAGNRLYLADSGSHEIKVFNRDGSLFKRFGRRGTGAGEFNFPTMVWINGKQQLLVADSLNFRVQIFDAKGNFLGQFGEAGDGAGYLAQPKGIATDSLGQVYVVDSMQHAVQIFDPAGDFLYKLGYRGEGVGEFWLPAGIFIGADDTIYIADSYNGRVQVFHYLGGDNP